MEHLVTSVEAQKAAEQVIRPNNPNVLDANKLFLNIQRPVAEEITQIERRNYTPSGNRVGITYNRDLKKAGKDVFQKPLKVIIDSVSRDPAYVALCRLSAPAVSLISSLNNLTIKNENAVMAYRVLDHAFNQGGLVDAVQLQRLAVEIYAIRELDLTYAFKLLKQINTEGTRLSANFSTLIPNVTAWLDEQQIQRDFIQNLQSTNVREQFSRKETSLQAQISGAINRQRIEEIICNQPGIDPNNRVALDQLVQQRIVQIETLLDGALHQALAARSEEERAKRIDEFVKSLNYFVNGNESGVIDRAIALKLVEQTNKMIDESEGYQSELARHDAGNENLLVQQMMNAGVQFSERSRALCTAISSAEAFEHFIEQDQVYGNKYSQGGVFNWEGFMEDVGEMCDEILSVLDNHPNETFDRAINQMYEGHFYEVLITRLRKLGTELTGRAVGSKKVRVKEVVPVDREYNKSGDLEAGTIRLFQDSYREQSLSEAIGNYLKNSMSDKYEVAEFLHNVDVISRKGMGWEQLKQYSAMLNLAGIDRLFHDDKELSLAYEYYLRAIQEDLGLGLHITGSDYGYTDMSRQLDSTQTRALLQLKAHYGQNIAQNIGGDENSVPARERDELMRRLKRKLRQATAISKGVTTEYWGIFLSARTPLICERVVDPDGKVKYVTKTTFMSIHDSGVEKQIGELDFDITMQRFLTPNHLYAAARYAFITRDLTKVPEAWSKEGMFLESHGNVYQVRDWIEDATWDGCNSDLEAFDERYEVISESLKEKGVDAMVRGGWRFLYHEIYTITKPGSTELDFNRCIGALEKLGPFGIKIFIDGLDFTRIGSDAVTNMIGQNKSGGELTAAEKDQFKIACYEKLIFQRMFDAKPSKFLTLETRRFSPKEEFVVEHMNRFLRGKFVRGGTQQQYDYPRGLVDRQIASLFTSAMGLAERITWENRKTQGIGLQYVFDQTHLQAVRSQLIDYYREYRANIGNIAYKLGDTERSINFMQDVNEDQFMQMMGEYLQNLRGALTEDRFAKTADYEAMTTAQRRGQALSQDLLSHRQTLAQRYAKLLYKKRANLVYLIGGDDFDLNQFYLSNGGRRVTERSLGEVFEGVVKVNVAARTLLGEGIPAFVQKTYENEKELEAALIETIVKPIAEGHTAYMNTMGKEPIPADEWAVRMTMYVAKIIGIDRPYRIAGLGWVLGWVEKNLEKTQLSLAQEFFRDVARRHTTGLTVHGLEILGKKVASACKISWDARRRSGTKTVEVKGLFGGKTKKDVAVFEELPIHMGIFRKAEGLNLKSQVIEQSTMPPFILFLILMALLRLAIKKNSGKSQ